MTTATLTRPLRALPGRRPGALVAPHHNVRPCVTYPVGWWDTGNPNNPHAKELCRTACPLFSACHPQRGEKPLGVIRAAVAYDDDGNKARQCEKCSAALNKGVLPTSTQCDQCKRGRLATYRHLIAEMQGQGCSFAVIGRAIDYHGDTVRKYWLRHRQQTAATA